MPRISFFPHFYDSCKQVSITKLKEWGYLQPNQSMSGTLTWSRNGNETGSISVWVNTDIENSYVQFDYTYKKTEKVKYEVELVQVPSNLGKGFLWYFRCPHTHKLCRKLYCLGKYFLHREAYRGCFYESQTKSKYYRYIEKRLDPMFRKDQIYKELHKPYLKKYYNGKPTKRYVKLMNELEKARSVSLEEYQRLVTI